MNRARRVGRPHKGPRHSVITRLPIALAELVFAAAERNEMSRSDYVAAVLAARHGYLLEEWRARSADGPPEPEESNHVEEHAARARSHRLPVAGADNVTESDEPGRRAQAALHRANLAAVEAERPRLTRLIETPAGQRIWTQLGRDSGWTDEQRMIWFHAPNAWLGGRTPADEIEQRGDSGPLARAANATRRAE